MNISVKSVPVNQSLDQYIRRICVFEGKSNEVYVQTLTPSPFCCLSYTMGKLPGISIAETGNSHSDFHFVGAKLNNDIRVEYSGRFKQVFIEFTTLGFYQLFKISPGRIVNKSYSVSDLNNTLLNDLFDLVKGEPDMVKVSQIIQTFLTSLIKFEPEVPNYVKKAVVLINSNPLSTRLPDKSEFLTSPRNLSRAFKYYVGMNPKQYHHLIKLRNIMELFYQQQSIPNIAFDSGFYDLSHFNKFLSQKTGFAPHLFQSHMDEMKIKKQFFSS